MPERTTMMLLALLTLTGSGFCAPQLGRAYGKLPLSFEANTGQAESEVRFLARAARYTVLLTARGVRWSFPDCELSLEFDGANSSSRIAGLDPLPARSNYLIGGDPARWRTGIPHFARILYREVYPGIDLVFYGSGGRLEYDFVVAPGADPSRIGLIFGGAQEVRLERGDLHLLLAGGSVRQHRPRIYQQAGAARMEISGGYRLEGNRVRFQVGAYDRRQSLVIDPVLTYSTYLGGADSDTANGIAVDAAGNAYLTGSIASTTLPVTPGAPQSTNRGSYDAFVVKLNPAGNSIVYATYLGGSGNESGTDIAVDAGGNVFVTGFTASSGFPTTPGAFQRSLRGSQNAFVAKLNPAGTALVYSTFLGGGGRDFANAIALAPSGDVYVTGGTSSQDFPTVRPIQSSHKGGTGLVSSDVFVARLNAAGSALVYSTYLGGSGNEQGNGIALDGSGSAYVAGSTNSAAFPTSAGAIQPSLRGFQDAFAVKLAADGSALLYATFLGGAGATSEANGIAVDKAGNAYIAGTTQSTSFPTTPGSFQPAFPREGIRQAFVTKLAAAGDSLIYSTYFGGRGETRAEGIAIDSGGNAYLTGETDSIDFPTVAPLQAARASTLNDAFLIQFNALGTAPLFSTYLGGAGSDYGRRLALDPAGSVYLAGETGSSNFPTAGPLQPARGGNSDAFIAKVDFATQPRITAEGIVNAASFARGAVAPGEIVSIFGADLGPIEPAYARLDENGRVATAAGGTRVLFDGVPAPLFFVRNDQVNLQVPYTVAGRATTAIQVEYQGSASNTVTAPVAASAPGIFAIAGGRDQAVAFTPDGRLNSRSEPAAPGSIIVLYATGEGQTNPPGIDGKLADAPYPAPAERASVTIGGLPADLDFAAAAPGYAGLMQINARIPSGVPPGGAVPVVLQVGQARSQDQLTIAIASNFRIANLRATGSNTSQGAVLSVVLDFDDPSGAATRDRIRMNFDIGNGGLKGFSELRADGVTPGQTSGTMTLTFTFTGSRFTGASAPIVISLVNSLGIESNQLTGVFTVQ